MFGLLTLLLRTENFKPHSSQEHQNPQNHSTSELEGVSGPDREVVFHSKEEETHREGKAKLAEKVRVLCWVMTGPVNHRAKVRQAVMLDLWSSGSYRVWLPN